MSRVILQGKLANETVIETFDFTSRLSAGETISSASVAASVYSGTDSNPSAIVSGASTISGQKVTQAITSGTLGVTYELLCTATTSLLQVLQLSAYLTITPDLT